MMVLLRYTVNEKIYMHDDTQAHTHTQHMQAHTNMCRHTYMYTHVQTHKCTHARTHTHTHTHKHVHTPAYCE